MIVPDANLLLYAYDELSAMHAPARAWWEACLSGNVPIGLTHPVLFGFVRIGASPRAFQTPLTLAQASSYVAAWLDRRVVRILHPDADHVSRALTLLREAASAGGNLVTDAQVAALAIAHRGTVHTADRDFLRFPGLACSFPLDAA